MLKTNVHGVPNNYGLMASVQGWAFESKMPRKPLMDCVLKDNPGVQGMGSRGAPLGEHLISKFLCPRA
jgi:hypothetical protein